MNDYEDIQLSCIVSLPRSGSTVLTAELDRFEGVVCVPETYFPQILDFLPAEELQSPKRLAQVFLATCDAGFLLDQGELEQLIQPDDWRKTFISIGLCCAEKAGRDPYAIRAIVWKSTRMLTGFQRMQGAGAKFVILRRNPINVYESQFRVDFGIHNRNIIRFAAFRQSYEALFTELQKAGSFQLEYESIPQRMDALLDWVGGTKQLRAVGESTMAHTMAQHDWHKGLLDGFNCKDEEKRKNVSLWQRALFWLASAAFCPLQRYWLAKRKQCDAAIAAQKYDKANYV